MTSAAAHDFEVDLRRGIDDGVTIALRPAIALVHDYLTTFGGAERVFASFVRAFPYAPLYTTLYEPEGTYPEFRNRTVHTSALQRIGRLRRNHRLAMPLLAPVVTRMQVDADVVVCSSSGWSHGVDTDGRRIVYCHNPARWLYQRDEYVAGRPLWRATTGVLAPYLKRWDRRAAHGARYLANSSIVAARIRHCYGIEPELLPPPTTFDPRADRRPVEGIEPGFVLNVSRLMAHKNVDAVVHAFESLPDERLVVAGDGPELDRLRSLGGRNVHVLGRVDDAQLRWLFANAKGLVAASREDFGLTPLEAASFGLPSALLRFGGFLDTMIEDETAVFFDEPAPAPVADAVRRLGSTHWSTERIHQNAARFSEDRFVRRLREIVAEELRA